MGSVLEVKNPPHTRAIRAALLAAAMTDGSSVAIGTKKSRSLIVKFKAIPRGDAEDTDSVLDHMGSLLEGQTLLRPQDIERRRLEPGRLDQQLVSGIDLKITKSSEPARTHQGDYLLDNQKRVRMLASYQRPFRVNVSWLSEKVTQDKASGTPRPTFKTQPLYFYP